MTMAIQSPHKPRKADRIRVELEKMAVARGPGSKLPTLQELCEHFQVARGTLEQAMAPLEARGVLYRKHGSGIYVTERIQQKSIGVVFGDNIFKPGFSPFWGLLLQTIRDQAHGGDFLARSYFGMEGHDGGGCQVQLLEDLAAQRVDGLLLLGPNYRYDEAGMLRSTGVPLVVFGGDEAGWTVTMDMQRFLRLAVQRLAVFGVRHIAFMGQPVRRPYLDAELQRTGLEQVRVDDWSYDTWGRIITHAGTHEHCAYRMAQRLTANLRKSPLPEAVISEDDTMTRGVILALREAGLRPGADTQIITSSNRGAPVVDTENITCLEYDPLEIVEAALAMLNSLMEGATPPENPVRIAPKEKGPNSK